MKFFEKVKNMFTEEVEEDVKIEQVKGDSYKPVTEKEIIKKEEQKSENFKFDIEEKISTPIFFDDNDFRDLNLTKAREEKPEKKERVETKEKELYGIKKDDKIETKKIFKPTPIISPVYGVLDKNYYKEDIVSRDEVKKVNPEVSESSIDMVRAKAYGTLEDELENTLFGSNSILFKKDEEEKLELQEVNADVLTDLTDDISRELDELLIRKEKYIDKESLDNTEKEEFEKSQKVNDDISDDLFNFIDSTLYKNGDEE